MRPAFSVIFLTTLIGAGQGLVLALYTAELYALFDLLPASPGAGLHVAGVVFALALLLGGLGASFLHLGHPERAWRAISQWRTSWLSREVIVLPAFMGATALYGLAHALGWSEPLITLPGGHPIGWTTLFGAAATVLAFALYLCTAMIYACLKFLQEWHTPLTVANYLLLGAASGFTLATALAAVYFPEVVGFFSGWAIVLTLSGFVSRVASLLRNARLVPKSTLRTAIGVKHPRIAQKSQGFLGGSFNTREFFHGRTAQFVRAVKWTFLLLAFPLPVALLAAGAAEPGGALLPALAFAVQYAGLTAERWFFFAQANHPQNLYYQTVS